MDHSIATLTERERACIRFFASRFEQGEESYSTSAELFTLDGVKLGPTEFSSLMGMMIGFGVIKELGRGFDGSRDFVITHMAVLLAREIEKGIAMDLVESMRLTVRRNPLVAWPFMILLGVVFVATAINQISGAVKAVVEFFK